MPPRAPLPLSRDRVLAVGVALADRHGLGAVTMRRLAEELGCEAMSIYHHVPGKAALLEGLVDAVVAEVGVVWHDPTYELDAGDWRGGGGRRCLAARQVMAAHPWARDLVAVQAATPPSSFVVFESLVGTLRTAGFGTELAHRAVHAFGAMVLGFTHELFEPRADDPGTSEQDLTTMAAAFPSLTWLGGPELHAQDGALSRCDTQAEFEFTLGLVLDGLQRCRDAAVDDGPRTG